MKANIESFGGVSPTVGERVYVSEHALVIGRVTLLDDVSIWPMTVLRGDVNDIFIGARSNIQDASIGHVASPKENLPDGYSLHVGEDVTVGHRVLLHGCRIGDRCLIGMDAVVMDGAVIEDEVLLAAGSLVTPGKTLEARSLYQGRPARKVRALSEQEVAQFRHGASHYVALKDIYLAEMAARDDDS